MHLPWGTNVCLDCPAGNQLLEADLHDVVVEAFLGAAAAQAGDSSIFTLEPPGGFSDSCGSNTLLQPCDVTFKYGTLDQMTDIQLNTSDMVLTLGIDMLDVLARVQKRVLGPLSKPSPDHPVAAAMTFTKVQHSALSLCSPVALLADAIPTLHQPSGIWMATTCTHPHTHPHTTLITSHAHPCLPECIPVPASALDIRSCLATAQIWAHTAQPHSGMPPYANARNVDLFTAERGFTIWRPQVGSHAASQPPSSVATCNHEVSRLHPAQPPETPPCNGRITRVCTGSRLQGH